MSPSLIRALRGPVLLITMGILFAFDQMADIRFASSWPVLIIVFGIMKLGESMAVRSQSHPPAVSGGHS